MMKWPRSSSRWSDTVRSPLNNRQRREKIRAKHLRISANIGNSVLNKRKLRAVLAQIVYLLLTYETEVINHEILHNGRFPAIYYKKL